MGMPDGKSDLKWPACAEEGTRLSNKMESAGTKALGCDPRGFSDPDAECQRASFDLFRQRRDLSKTSRGDGRASAFLTKGTTATCIAVSMN